MSTIKETKANTPRRNKTVTVMDVAHRAGVSHTTVSAALRGVGRISESRREEILELAREMNYRPNFGAQLMRSRHTGILGLIMRQSDPDAAVSSFHASILHHFVSRCESESTGYHIEFVPGEDEPFTTPTQLGGRIVDGALLVGLVDPRLREWLTDQGRYPWVSLEEQAPYCVTSSTDQGIYDATARLAALGHRRIAFCSGPLQHGAHRLGWDGFERARNDFALDTHGEQWRKEVNLLTHRDVLKSTYEWFDGLFRAHESDRPTAIVCNDMRMARAAIYVAMKHQLDIPRDLSIFAHANKGDAEKAYPCVSTVELDYNALVERGVYLLQRLVDNKTIDTPQFVVSPRLFLRDTTAPAPDR